MPWSSLKDFIILLTHERPIFLKNIMYCNFSPSDFKNCRLPPTLIFKVYLYIKMNGVWCSVRGCLKHKSQWTSDGYSVRTTHALQSDNQHQYLKLFLQKGGSPSNSYQTQTIGVWILISGIMTLNDKWVFSYIEQGSNNKKNCWAMKTNGVWTGHRRHMGLGEE